MARPRFYGEKLELTGLHLRSDQMAWLRKTGNASETMRNLIDAAMKAEQPADQPETTAAEATATLPEAA